LLLLDDRRARAFVHDLPGDLTEVRDRLADQRAARRPPAGIHRHLLQEICDAH